MEERFAPLLKELTKVLVYLEQWFNTRVLTLNTAVQWGLSLITLLVTLFLWRLLKKRSKAWGESQIKGPLGKVLLEAFLQTGSLFIFLVLIQISAFTFFQMGYNPWVIMALSELTLAGIVIRLVARVMPNKVLARSLASVAWVIISLHILGLFTPVADFLDGLSFTVGEATFSVLDGLKGLGLAVILLQGASLMTQFMAGRITQNRDISPSVQALLIKVVKVGLFTVAVLLAMVSVGINLTSLAIFSSALGVGIGFGLQTIISNYVAGVILLADRSIKPGDTIEVGGVFGVVRGLFGRHTSVLTRDGKEYLIPNQQLITNEVVNWTYSDTNIRLKVPVGVAYESDVPKALKLMEEAGASTPRVLKYPAPRALLMEFGDSSVNLQLRAWIADTNHGVSNVTSEILIRIWDLFHENGVQFPFPQRDVLLKPGSALSVSLDRGEGRPDHTPDDNSGTIPEPRPDEKTGQ